MCLCVPVSQWEHKCKVCFANLDLNLKWNFSYLTFYCAYDEIKENPESCSITEVKLCQYVDGALLGNTSDFLQL